MFAVLSPFLPLVSTMQKYCRVKFNQEQTLRDGSHYQGLFTFVAFISVLFASGARMRPDPGVYRVVRCSSSLIEDTMSSSHRRDQGRHSSDYVDAPQPRRTICDQKLAAWAVLFPLHACAYNACTTQWEVDSEHNKVSPHQNEECSSAAEHSNRLNVI